MASAASAAGATLANWNIQTLTYPSDAVTVFPDDYRRQPADFADLVRWRDRVGADAYFLQEISSPAALDAVFPVADGWTHCISGQFAAAEAKPAKPDCTTPGQTATKPMAPTRGQFTAVALRPGSPLTLVAADDYAALNVKSLDNGVERDVRWGLDLTLGLGADRLRVLVVHMKSGCFDDPIKPSLWLTPPGSPPAGTACDTLGRQLHPLRQWVEAREAAGDAWMVVGDFNRRLDAGAGRFQDEVWRALSGYAANARGEDRDSRPDIALFRSPYKEASACWHEFRDPGADLSTADAYNLMPIEFFLYGSKAAALVVPDSGRQVAWPHAVAADPRRLSDHCPETLRILED